MARTGLSSSGAKTGMDNAHVYAVRCLKSSGHLCGLYLYSCRPLCQPTCEQTSVAMSSCCQG